MRSAGWGQTLDPFQVTLVWALIPRKPPLHSASGLWTQTTSRNKPFLYKVVTFKHSIQAVTMGTPHGRQQLGLSFQQPEAATPHQPHFPRPHDIQQALIKSSSYIPNFIIVKI